MALKPPAKPPTTQRDWDQWTRSVAVVPDKDSTGADELRDNSVTNVKLRDSVAVSVIGRASATDGDPADIVATSNDTILRRTGDALGFGSVTLAMVPDNLLTYAKLQDVSATDMLLGRSTADAGDIEEIPCTAAGRALLDDADAATQRTTLGLGTAATKSTGTSGDAVPLLNGANTWSEAQTLTKPPVLPSHVISSLPSASPAAQLIYVSDESGGAVLAFSDGADWRRVTDRAVVT